MRERPAPETATVWQGDTAYVGLLPAGPIVVLEGTGALLWSLLLEGDGTPLISQAADATGLTQDEVREGVEAFLAQGRQVGIVAGG